MPPIATHQTAIDRKLQKIALDSGESYGNMMELAVTVAEKQYNEFSYMRNKKKQYSSAGAIHSYVSYARAIGLLNVDLGPTKPKQDIRGLESFQQWLGDSVLDYLTQNHCPIHDIEAKVQALLQHTPPKLPTQEKIRSQFSDPPSAVFFRFSLAAIALLRPAVLQAKSRKTILMPGVFEE
jgi:hypothetical protein